MATNQQKTWPQEVAVGFCRREERQRTQRPEEEEEAVTGAAFFDVSGPHLHVEAPSEGHWAALLGESKTLREEVGKACAKRGAAGVAVMIGQDVAKRLLLCCLAHRP